MSKMSRTTNDQSTPTKPSRSRSRKASRSRPVPRLQDFGGNFHLFAYCIQLEMMRDRLDQHVPPDGEHLDPMQLRQLANVRRFLKGAATSLSRLMQAYNDRYQREIE